jgi:hypothetical protein
MIYPQRWASYGEKNRECKRNLGRYQSGNGPFRLDGEISALAKSLQSLFKKVTDAGVVKNSELPEQRISFQRKAGDPANHKEFLEPMEALSTVS